MEVQMEIVELVWPLLKLVQIGLVSQEDLRGEVI